LSSSYKLYCIFLQTFWFIYKLYYCCFLSTRHFNTFRLSCKTLFDLIGLAKDKVKLTNSLLNWLLFLLVWPFFLYRVITIGHWPQQSTFWGNKLQTRKTIEKTCNYVRSFPTYLSIYSILKYAMSELISEVCLNLKLLRVYGTN
jgi:hypothetical protein